MGLFSLNGGVFSLNGVCSAMVCWFYGSECSGLLVLWFRVQWFVGFMVWSAVVCIVSLQICVFVVACDVALHFVVCLFSGLFDPWFVGFMVQSAVVCWFEVLSVQCSGVFVLWIVGFMVQGAVFRWFEVSSVQCAVVCWFLFRFVFSWLYGMLRCILWFACSVACLFSSLLVLWFRVQWFVGLRC